VALLTDIWGSLTIGQLAAGVNEFAFGKNTAREKWLCSAELPWNHAAAADFQQSPQNIHRLSTPIAKTRTASNVLSDNRLRRNRHARLGDLE
jgi:hypothetical protein